MEPRSDGAGRPGRYGCGDWISIPAAADILGVSRRNLLRLVERGLFTTRRFEGGQVRLNRLDVLARAEAATRPAIAIASGVESAAEGCGSSSSC